MWVPAGFAHGFYVVSESAELVYKCTEYYHPEDDYSLLWNDPELAIVWPLVDSEPLLSDKDKNAKPLSQAALFK
jgi:dTDP-4-dehydrorhamnose 3,5-epimerase